MRIAVYVGYQSQTLDPNVLEHTGIGGTELACIRVAEELATYGHKVFLCGQVANGWKNGVEWVSLDRILPMEIGQLDAVIAASYIHFVKTFEPFLGIKKIFWAHNTDFHPWYQGQVLPNAEAILTSGQIDQVVCLTNWHKEQWSRKYGQQNITVIGNGIDTSVFNLKLNKIKNRFIWSSAPERGLFELLQHWYKIRQVKPDATLEVFCPSYALDQLEQLQSEDSLLNQPGIIVRGSQPRHELHTSMLRAEYWFYLTDYEETYCITALEMQMAGVLPVVTEVAALAETVHSGILLDNDETKWDLAVQLLSILGPELKAKAVKSAQDWARQQSWSFRANEWHQLLKRI